MRSRALGHSDSSHPLWTPGLGFPSKQYALFINLNEQAWMKKIGMKSSWNTGTKCLCSTLTEGSVIGENTSSFSIMSLILIPGNPTEAFTKWNHSVLIKFSDIKVAVWTCLTLIGACKLHWLSKTALAILIYSSLSWCKKNKTQGQIVEKVSVTSGNNS